jgi:hypothetical protein
VWFLCRVFVSPYEFLWVLYVPSSSFSVTWAATIFELKFVVCFCNSPIFYEERDLASSETIILVFGILWLFFLCLVPVLLTNEV